MKKNPLLKIALTHLFSKKRQTIVAMLGVTFGIAIFIFQAGLMSGFQAFFIEETVNTTANIRIYNEAAKNRPSILDEINTKKDHWNIVQNQKPKDEQTKIKNGYQIDRATSPSWKPFQTESFLEMDWRIF
ncbi:MAG: hypothetical protein NTX97_09810 [Bacteroidetes bacterium]|nr:hypothetical protein [Bacteroidota bacterium]